MVELKEQYPFVDSEGNIRDDLVKHYAEDEDGKKYLILQKETGIKYGEAVDVYPCRYTYEATDEAEEIPTEEIPTEDEHPENEEDEQPIEE